MDLVYYTHPAFFEPALCLTKALSERARVHLLLELSAGAWQSAAFDIGPRRLPAGIIAGDEPLADAFPAGVRDYWRAAASFHLVVHHSRRSLHPSAWRVSRQVLRFAERHGDVLHVDDVDVSPRLATALATTTSPPLVIAVHDPEPHSGETNWRKRLARRLAFPKARAFVLYNAAQRERFIARERLAAQAVHVTSLGAYEVFREWTSGTASPQPRPTVLFFGRLSPYKGLEVFYDAVPAIAAAVPGCRFVVAGRAVDGYHPPPPPAVPHATIEVMARYLATADTAALFRQATVVVCPYTDATQSGVVLTAYAFGVPVVATTVGGLPEYVTARRTGLLVPPRNARALADAVIEILVSPSLAADLRAGIEAESSGRLSWRNTADALMRVYTSVSP